MASTEPSRLHRARPWLAAKGLAKDPAVRLKGQIRKHAINLAFVVATLPLILGGGHPLWLVGPAIGAGVLHSLFVIRRLKTRPEIFLDKDAKTRALLADYRAQVAAGTWTGAKDRPTWPMVAPLAAIAVGIQPLVLLHQPWQLGLAAGVATFVGIVGFSLVKTRVTRFAPSLADSLDR